MIRSPDKPYQSNPDLNAASESDVSNNGQRKRKRSHEECSSLFEQLENSFTTKLYQMMAELRGEISKINENINSTVKSELATLNTTTSEIKKEINDLRAEYSGLKTHISELSTKYNALNIELTSLRDTVEFQANQQLDMKMCIDAVKPSTITNISDQLTNLQYRIDTMEQQARQCNLEVCNVPEKRGENLLTLIESIGTAIKHNIDRKDIISIHRVPHARSTENNRPKNIIVKLSSRLLRDNVLSAFRLNKGLKTDQLGITDTSRRDIYLNEHLTLRNKQLFRASREAAQKHGFKYIWIKNATILARKSDTSPILAIRSQSDIEKLTKNIK